MTALLEICGLHAGYHGRAVVRDLDLVVDQGEVVALLGPTGAGRTTTLRAVSGLSDVIHGSIAIFGRSTRGRSPHAIARSGLAHVPQDRPIFPNLTVRENLSLGSRRRNETGAALTLFPELEALLDRRAGRISGGEQQMLAIGKAIGARPRLLLVDEMSLGLAPVIVRRLLHALRLLADDSGCGALLVEQHARLALGCGARRRDGAGGRCAPCWRRRHSRSIA